MIFRRIERFIAGIQAPLKIKLQFGFFLLIGVLLLTGIVSLLAIAEIREHAHQLDRLDESVHLALEVEHSIVLQEHLSSMFLLTVEKTYSTKLEGEQQKFRALLAQLGSSGGTGEEIAAIEQAFARYVRAADRVRQLRREEHEHEAQALHVAQEHTIAHEIETLTKAAVARLKTLQGAKHHEMLAAQRRTTGAIVGFVILSVALALVLGSILASAILHPVRKVDTALERIAQGDFVMLDDVVNRDELGSLANNLNRTSRQLSALYAKERQTAQALEEQLAALEHTQAQLRQAQKMEVVGRLAGGVAHDFNNLLTVITGRAALLLMELPPDDPKRRGIDLITQTADRASALTRQLLALSRKQVLQPRIVDLNELVEGLEPILQRLIGEHIELHVTPAAGAAAVKADPTQIEQVILNLAVNARDAMPSGGLLTIELSQVPAGPRFDEGNVVGPGVSLAVRDSGTGMTPDVQAHMFEPFFTTKGPGMGTGLGLATVYGIIKQSGGSVSIESELGHGTTFMIWLPRVENPGQANRPPRRGVELGHGRETILLVEDEDGVRELAGEVLQGHGYTVIEARDGESALRIVERRGERLHLLLTDVVMPKMVGPELVRRLISRHPDVKVLYMSGYPDGALGEHGVLEPGATFLQKPFTPQGLANKVRQVLDGTPTSMSV
jgi:signal transduction histidine kinase/ActR/RegA family two-component response regulator